MFKERIYKIWKQFTTTREYYPSGQGLCSKNEYTKSESNSQLLMLASWHAFNCVQRTNIQNLKAIHNQVHQRQVQWPIVFKERIYKIWKQFTTSKDSSLGQFALCSKNEYTKSESNSQPGFAITEFLPNCVQRTNIQNLKAIHNWYTACVWLP